MRTILITMSKQKSIVFSVKRKAWRGRKSYRIIQPVAKLNNAGAGLHSRKKDHCFTYNNLIKCSG